MLKNLVGNHISVITREPAWVSFAGPDADEANRYGLFVAPWPREDGSHDGVFIRWNENGIICEVSGAGEHYKEVIA